MSNSQPRFGFLPLGLWMIVLGVMLRVGWALLVPVEPVADSHAYHVFASNLVTCNQYGWNCTEPSAYWPVGTSFVYSLLYRVFGVQFWPIVGFHILLAGLTMWGAMDLARRWFGQRIAVLAGLILAIWPSQIQFTTVLSSEPLFTALSVGAVWMWLNLPLRFWTKSTLVGIVLAATAYVRPTALIFPLVFFLFGAWTRSQIRQRLLAVSIILAVMITLIAPWSIRNTQAFGQFVTISTNGGANLWMGNNPASTGGAMLLPPETNSMNEAVRDRYLKEKAMQHIRERPDLFILRTFQRLYVTYSRESIGISWNRKALRHRYGEGVLIPLKALNQLYWLPMLLLSLMGAGLVIHRLGWLNGLLHPTIAIWIYFTAVHATVVAQDRYHFPCVPFMAILAALTLITSLDAARTKVEPSEMTHNGSQVRSDDAIASKANR